MPSKRFSLITLERQRGWNLECTFKHIILFSKNTFKLYTCYIFVARRGCYVRITDFDTLFCWNLYCGCSEVLDILLNGDVETSPMCVLHWQTLHTVNGNQQEPARLFDSAAPVLRYGLVSEDDMCMVLYDRSTCPIASAVGLCHRTALEVCRCRIPFMALFAE